MDAATARTRLATMTAWESEPTLTSAELDDLVVMARRADAGGLAPVDYAVWIAGTVYALGAERIPTARNGHYYAVTTAGTSGATEPTWPTTSGATVTDGTVVWTEQGAAWAGVYDLNSAASEGWRWKAAKAASKFDVSTDGQSLSRSQVIAHCQEMAMNYQRRVVQHIPVYGTLTSTEV